MTAQFTASAAKPAAQSGWQRHVTALDGLRGLAILLVIPHNADVFSHASAFMWPAAMLAHAGWIGVQLFFVLSGFLITGNLLDSQRSSNYYSSFFARRALRIFPLYYGVLVLGLVVLPHVATLSPQTLASHTHQIWLWTFLVNWAEPFDRTVWGFPHFWSLAIEEQFYLVWPFLVHKRTPRAVWTLCAGIVVAAFVFRCAMMWSGIKPEALYMFTVSRMDALAIGAACAALLRTPATAAILHRYDRHYWKAGLLLVIAMTVATRGFEIYGADTFTYGYPLVSIGFALLLLATLTPSAGSASVYQSMLNFAPLRSVGKYSYAIYVLHMPIQLTMGAAILPWLRSSTTLYPLIYPVLIAALSYLAAFASYHLYEKHFLKLKRYFVPSHVTSPAALSGEPISPS